MNYFLKRSEELFDETVQNRRYIHENAECGMELPKTVAYVVEKLKEYGYDNVEMVGGGVTCTVGKGDKVLLLRGDMDALHQEEESGEPFACTTGACHSCGHDMHTAMLLTAAKMLKEKEDELNNVIKFMFQPGEEELAGAKAMIAAGILENPKVDYAFGIHTVSQPTGRIIYNYGRTRAAAGFTVEVKGVACHGSAPFKGVNAASAASNIVAIAQQILAYEVAPGNEDILTFGVIQAGTAENIIPEIALLKGTIRSFSNENMDFLKKRFAEVVENVAKALRAEVNIVFNPEIYALENNEQLVTEFIEYLKELTDDVVDMGGNDKGTEDFAAISVKVPTMYINVGVGDPDEGYMYPGHNPKNRRNEEGMKIGAAAYANCAFQWAMNCK